MASQEHIEALWTRYLKNHADAEAKDALTLNYLPLVKYVAGRLAITLPSHVDINDLIGSGVIGLISAIENFEPKYKTKFETYAIIRIRGSMLDELRSLDWVPRSAREKFVALQRAHAAIEQEFGRAARDDELAERLQLTLNELGSLMNDERSVAFLSLNELLNPDDGDRKAVSMIDAVSDESQPSPFSVCDAKEKRAILAQAVQDLPEQERIVIALYYYEQLMLKEIGAVLGISESRVSQIHTKALTRLGGKLRRCDSSVRALARTSHAGTG
ncbi:MAG: FliA/WhiG family RNA polymerase sigma factor [Verrucomicrobia bacterium]|nr:FliA/WhiG family RNA polymerase sigma factor [Verrucomicrobiota bacterium]